MGGKAKKLEGWVPHHVLYECPPLPKGTLREDNIGNVGLTKMPLGVFCVCVSTDMTLFYLMKFVSIRFYFLSVLFALSSTMVCVMLTSLITLKRQLSSVSPSHKQVKRCHT